MLRAEGVAHLLVDRDARVVAAARREGRPVHYGEADQPRFLELCGVGEARALIISIDTASDFKAIIAAAQAVRPDICIIARARDARHAEALYASGASVAVPETIEASLQLSEAALVEAGVPMGRVIAAIHDRRDAFRAVLRAKAGRNEPARQDGGQEDQDAASFDRASPGSG
jgi:CPA2 family monovalent cation:H+ antiporter-2